MKSAHRLGTFYRRKLCNLLQKEIKYGIIIDRNGKSSIVGGQRYGNSDRKEGKQESDRENNPHYCDCGSNRDCLADFGRSGNLGRHCRHREGRGPQRVGDTGVLVRCINRLSGRKDIQEKVGQIRRLDISASPFFCILNIRLTDIHEFQK